MPRLTVLLPALNAEDTISTAVASTLRGMPRGSQLFVLDDGSTDNTAARALEAGTRRGVVDKRLRIVSRPPSGGLATALNSMLAETDSALVGRMDADDVSLPWRFRVSLPALDRGADVAFTQSVWMTGRRITPEPPLGISTQAFPVHLLMTNPVAHPTMVAHRSAFTRVDGYRQVPAEDYDLWLRMAAHGIRLRRIAPVSMICRRHPSQLTAADGWYLGSWNNPTQAEAFADLSERITGRRLRRIVATAQLPPAEREAELREFEELVDAAISGLPRRQQVVLRHRLKKRLAWARAYPAEHPAPRDGTEGGDDNG